MRHENGARAYKENRASFPLVAHPGRSKLGPPSDLWAEWVPWSPE
jgi:hypothetical protein